MNEDAALARVLLEVCVGSVADIEAAMAARADRVELCAALELGGLTPSIGLVETVLAATTLPVIVMLRPRAGGFCYDRQEFAAMLRDADQFLAAGASGVAFGILDRQGQIDAVRSREIVERAGTRQSVFHRAFDFTTDRRATLDTLIAMRCTRVLSSGGQPTALAGGEELGELVRHAAGAIEMMAGGGINAENVAEIIRTTGCRQIHIGASGPADDRSIGDEPAINLCDQRFMQGAAYRAVVGENVAATWAAVHEQK